MNIANTYMYKYLCIITYMMYSSSKKFFFCQNLCNVTQFSGWCLLHFVVSTNLFLASPPKIPSLTSRVVHTHLSLPAQRLLLVLLFCYLLFSVKSTGLSLSPNPLVPEVKVVSSSLTEEESSNTCSSWAKEDRMR